MHSSSKRIATQLQSRYGGLKDVVFSVEQNTKPDGNFGSFGIRVDWTADEKEPVVHPHGMMWFAENEEEAYEVLRWIDQLQSLRRGSAATEPRRR